MKMEKKLLNGKQNTVTGDFVHQAHHTGKGKLLVVNYCIT